ncbi:hypothetical protein AVEN_265513-1 [Araneus ventricosus]|uniref:Uncharacterized protein n=1 Tax=Araneus ventricosus TaxID=182803 RepID=A0A4Y2LD13_ARAVE|nr:hypothetical protein AVEN_265513-1 [Araneus ventricosus]
MFMGSMQPRSGGKGTQTTDRRVNSPSLCSLRETVWRDIGLPAVTESCDTSCRAPMDDTTKYIQLSGNSGMSCTSLKHTDSPPTHLIVQIVSSTHAFRFRYLGFHGTIAACELKHK